ncbi:MAG: prenyltransferase [Muribaculaceae bacterium]|nr:prenyltransferase [Muribaculaceae bacterium]
MNSLTRTIIYNAHPASLIISAGAVMGGLTAAVIRGGIAIFPAIMTLLFALLLQTSANLYHGYFDLCFGSGENISGMTDRDSRSRKSAQVMLLKIVANGFGILTITAGISLFTFIGWLGTAYFAIILVLLYFYFAGPSPIIRTKWSVGFTFLFFGPICVSGTALIQNMHSNNWLPVIVYSVITGLLAVNAHIAVQYLRYSEDLMNCKETLVTYKEGSMARVVYLINAVLVTAILIIRPSAVEFVTPWVGIIIGVCLLISSIWVFTHMHKDPITVSRLVRRVTMWQYIVVTVTLMAIVLYSMEDFKINVIKLI